MRSRFHPPSTRLDNIPLVRLAGCDRFQQRVQVRDQRRVGVHDTLATAAGAPRAPAIQRVVGSQFLDAARDPRPRHAGRARAQGDSPAADRFGFGSHARVVVRCSLFGAARSISGRRSASDADRRLDGDTDGRRCRSEGWSIWRMVDLEDAGRAGQLGASVRSCVQVECAPGGDE